MVAVDDFIEGKPDDKGCRLPKIAGDWHLFQVTQVNDDGFYAVCCAKPSSLPYFMNLSASWRPRESSRDVRAYQDLALFARVCYGMHTDSAKDLQRLSSLVDNPKAENVATRLLGTILRSKSGRATRPKNFESLWGLRGTRPVAQEARKLIIWAPHSDDSKNPVQLPDTHGGFKLEKCSTSDSGYKDVFQGTNANQKKAWRANLGPDAAEFYTDDVLLAAVRVAKAKARGSAASAAPAADEIRKDSCADAQPDPVLLSVKQQMAPPPALGSGASMAGSTRSRKSSVPAARRIGTSAAQRRTHSDRVDRSADAALSAAPSRACARHAQAAQATAETAAPAAETTRGQATINLDSDEEDSPSPPAVHPDGVPKKPGVFGDGASELEVDNDKEEEEVPCPRTPSPTPTARLEPHDSVNRGSGATAAPASVSGALIVFNHSTDGNEVRPPTKSSLAPAATVAPLPDPVPARVIDKWVYVSPLAGTSNPSASFSSEDSADFLANAPASREWRIGLERKRKRQESAEKAATFDAFLSTFGAKNARTDAFKALLARHFSSDLDRLDEFFASDSAFEELPGCCDLEVPHFRVALCGRYGKDQPQQRATRALNTGLARKRGREERALKATTLGELMATFGTDGSLDEFKRLIEELNCDLGEFVEFIVTPSHCEQLFAQLYRSDAPTAKQPTVSAVDELRTAFFGRYGHECLAAIPRVRW